MAVDVAASHPECSGRCYLAVYRGDDYLPPIYDSGPVDDSAVLHTRETITDTGNPPMLVGHIIGD